MIPQLPTLAAYWAEQDCPRYIGVYTQMSDEKYECQDGNYVVYEFLGGAYNNGKLITIIRRESNPAPKWVRKLTAAVYAGNPVGITVRFPLTTPRQRLKVIPPSAYVGKHI